MSYVVMVAETVSNAGPAENSIPGPEKRDTRKIDRHRAARRAFTIRAHLAVLGGGCILAFLAFAALTLMHFAALNRQAAGQALLSTTRAMSAAVDQKISAARAAISVLAGSRLLQEANFAAFYERSVNIGQEHGGYIVLLDRSHQILNTLQPYGADLPKPTTWGTRAIETGLPLTSDLFRAPSTNKPIIMVSTPVSIEGQPTYALILAIESQQLRDVLQAQSLPAGWRAFILDRTGTIMTRSVDPERWIGRKAMPEYLEKVLNESEGTFDSVTLEGIPVETAFTHTAAGWIIGMSVEKTILDAPLHHALIVIGGGGLWLLLLTGIGAVWWGKRLAKSTHALLRTAQALGVGAPMPEVGRLVYREAEEVLAAQRVAGKLLAQRAQERDHSDAELRAAAATLEKRVDERTEELLRTRDEADRANRAKSEFLASMSHELRTPLNAVIGFAQLLLNSRQEKLTPRQHESADYILKAGNQLLLLVTDVLDLAKIESGKLRMSLEPVGLADILDEVQATLTPVAKRAGVSLRVDLVGPADPQVLADRTRLMQVLQNLGTNAIKYNHPGGRMRISCEPLAEGYIRLSVADDGIGIAAARQAEVFQPFNRLGAENSTIEGTGIGLNICQRLVGMMQGRIGFSSQERVGSTFWVDVPQVLTRPAAPLEAVLEPETPASPVGAGRILLYIEDNPASLALMTALVEDIDGMTLLTAPTGSIGIELAVAHRPTVIIVDIHLADMTGYEILDKLKHFPETSRIPVLALSADALPRHIARGEQAGFYRYMTKPFIVADIVAAIATAAAAAEASATG